MDRTEEIGQIWISCWHRGRGASSKGSSIVMVPSAEGGWVLVLYKSSFSVGTAFTEVCVHPGVELETVHVLAFGKRTKL